MINRALLSLGRFLMAVIFLESAFKQAVHFRGMVGSMAGKGIPFTEIAAVGAIGFEALGGLMLATGFQPRTGAVLLILFLIPTTILFHPVSDPQQLTQFLKNLAILGGLCVVAATADGKRSG
jgi:uncharacterized membrane protein YphA (DoxX/SURF4 family)